MASRPDGGGERGGSEACGGAAASPDSGGRRSVRGRGDDGAQEEPVRRPVPKGWRGPALVLEGWEELSGGRR